MDEHVNTLSAEEITEKLAERACEGRLIFFVGAGFSKAVVGKYETGLFEGQDRALSWIDLLRKVASHFHIEETFPAEECYSVDLEPMPCFEEDPCFQDVSLGKIICPEPQSYEYTVYQESGAPIYRSKGVSSPKAVNNINNNEPLNTKNIQATKTETTHVSVYDSPVSQDTKGTDYNGVEVFPIYNKKK